MPLIACRSVSSSCSKTRCIGAVPRGSGEPGNPASLAALHNLLERQDYRIAYSRVAAEEINSRRFFNLNELAGLQMGLPELFEKTHRLAFNLFDAAMCRGCRSTTLTACSTEGVLRAAATMVRRDYQPLEATGERSGNLCAFARNHSDKTLMVAVRRLVHHLHQG